MNITRFRFLFVVALLSSAASAVGQETRYSAYHDYRLVTAVEGLTRPWAMAFLPDGDMLVTEKAGSLRVVRDGELLEEPVAGIPKVFDRGQGGLMDVVMHPDFADNQLLYLSYSKPLADGASTTAVIRGRYSDGRLQDVEELFEADSRGGGHYGSRIAFDGKGYMYITVGDRQVSPSGDLDAHPAQSLADHHGVVIRLHEDGSVPRDNPFVGKDNALPEIWSYGHRNPQGLVIDRDSGNIWITEHGPQGGDELNLVERGANYGWPVVGYGVNYGTGKAIHEGTHRDGMTQPRKVWVPSIATSGLILYQGDAFPHWRGRLLAGGLSGKQVALLELDGKSVVRQETLAHDIGRVRDIRTGPEGYIYLAIDDSDRASSILRLEPVPRQELSLTD